MTLLSVWNPLFDSRMFDCFDYSNDLYQSRDESGNLYLELDLPGMKKEDVKLAIKDSLLEIKAERKNRKLSVERKYRLPKSVDTEKLSAKMEDGVLYITVPPKTPEKEKTKFVRIE